jgi:hypothetical protein
MNPIAKLLILSGLVLVGAGLLFLVFDKIPWMGKLPGDIVIKREKFTFYFPLVTCLIISAIISIIFWFLRK